MFARRNLLVPAGLFAMLFLALSSNAIVSAKMFELRLRVQRDQIFNYRLSSDLMRSKIMNLIPHRDSYKDELWTAVAETSILRTPSFNDLGVASLWQKIGLPMVNTARRLCLKAGINLWDDAAILGRIQTAFLLERNNLYADAAAEYTPIADLVEGDERAFVVLHHGFCLAVLGRNSDAILKLEQVSRDVPGSMFDEDAKLILRLLRSGELRRKHILSEFSAENDRARALFQEGLYADALVHWEKSDRLTNEDRYGRAFSLEKTGKSDKAADEFLELSQGNDAVAIKANRRLLLIGFVYSGGENLQKFALENSMRLQDTAVAGEIKAASTRALSFQPANGSDSPGVIANRQARFAETIEKRIADVPAPIEISLSDGRVFAGLAGQRKHNQFILWLNQGSKLSLPLALVDSVRPLSPGDIMFIQSADGQQPAVRIQRRDGNLEILAFDSSMVQIGADEFAIRVVRKVFQ
ncbi:MAG: hypothetical protein K8S54_02400 [Spirochaetia bacterium]|nr:hypothetical protein [Spirochaetia bacterium]